MKSLLFILFWVPLFCSGLAQTDSTQRFPIQFSAYVDAYYHFSGNQPQSNSIPYFVSHHRHNEFNLNLIYLEAKAERRHYRAKVVPGWGTYMRANYGGEPPYLRTLLEATGGIKIRKTWIDAGVLPSPFGYESAISLDQINYSRSFSAENSPYFLTGVRWQFLQSKRWSAAVFAINGWQNIRETNQAKSMAGQVQFRVNPDIWVNLSVYGGKEPVPGGDRMRVFQDFYLVWDSGNHWKCVALYDAGLQEAGGSQGWDFWHTGNLTASRSLGSRWKLAGRGEFFSDRGGVLVPSITGGMGLTTWGGSLGLDWHPVPEAALRLEGKYLNGKGSPFLGASGMPKRESWGWLGGLAVKIQ